MSVEKLRASFKACRGPYPWADFLRLIESLGYVQLKGGRTGGARRKYQNTSIPDRIMLDEPHGKDMGPSMVRRLQKHLEARRLL